MPNMFKYFFTNIGSKLSKDIIVQANVTIYDYLRHMNTHDLFLTPVSKDEVIRVVQL